MKYKLWILKLLCVCPLDAAIFSNSLFFSICYQQRIAQLNKKLSPYIKFMSKISFLKNRDCNLYTAAKAAYEEHNKQSRNLVSCVGL